MLLLLALRGACQEASSELRLRSCLHLAQDLVVPLIKTPNRNKHSPLFGAPTRNRTWLAFHRGRVRETWHCPRGRAPLTRSPGCPARRRAATGAAAAPCLPAGEPRVPKVLAGRAAARGQRLPGAPVAGEVQHCGWQASLTTSFQHQQLLAAQCCAAVRLSAVAGGGAAVEMGALLGTLVAATEASLGMSRSRATTPSCWPPPSSAWCCKATAGARAWMMPCRTGGWSGLLGALLTCNVELGTARRRAVPLA